MASFPSSVSCTSSSSSSSSSYGELGDVASSENLAIHVYSELAQLHKHAMIPYLPRVMASLLSSLSFSPRLHHACSEVVSSIASHTIDPARDPTSNEEALRSLCKPLLASLSCNPPNLLLSAGSAACLRALVESEPWRCAPLDLQELLCARATMALELSLQFPGGGGSASDYLAASLLCLVRSLADLSSGVVVQGYGARLLKLAMEILQNPSSPPFSSSSSSSSSWGRKAACAKLLESILKVVDSDLLDLDLSPIMGALRSHRMERNPNPAAAAAASSSSASAAKPLQPSQKHNISLHPTAILRQKRAPSPISGVIRSSERSLAETILGTPQHGPRPCISSSPAPAKGDSFFCLAGDGDCRNGKGNRSENGNQSEKGNQSSAPDVSGRHCSYLRRRPRRKIHGTSYSRLVLNSHARMSDLVLSENRPTRIKPSDDSSETRPIRTTAISAAGAVDDDSDGYEHEDDDEDDEHEEEEEEEDQFCLSTIDRCMLQSNEVDDDDPRNVNLLKEALAYHGNKKLYSPDSDKCSSVVSSEHGTPQMKELLSGEMLSTPSQQQIQGEEDSSASEWEEQQSSDCSDDLEASCDFQHESPSLNHHGFSATDTASQVSDVISHTASRTSEISPDLQLGDRYAQYYLESQTLDPDLNPGSSYFRYSGEGDFVKVNSPVSQASSRSLPMRYSEANDTVISAVSPTSSRVELKSPTSSGVCHANKADDTATAEIRSAASVNCVLILHAQEPKKTVIKSPPRTIFGFLIDLLKKAKMVMELLFSLFIFGSVVFHVVEYLSDGRELSLVPT